jgi:hypothetical protein
MKGTETDCNKRQVIPDNQALLVVSASEEIPLQGNTIIRSVTIEEASVEPGRVKEEFCH